jgi:hypothetical protein
VFNGKWSASELHKWWSGLQEEINEIAEGTYFQVTMVIWDPEGAKQTMGSVSVSNTKSFPYLGMELFLSVSGALNFRVHLKENQHLKYLNRGSTHTRAVFASIPHGVLQRLATLTLGF